MDGLHPPFIIAWDYSRNVPLIRTQRGQHLIATIEREGDVGTQFARLFIAAPDCVAALKALLAAGYTREFEQVAKDAISKSET